MTLAMRFLIADDHTLFRRGLALLLTQSFPEAAVLEATDVAGALPLAGELDEGDLMLLDLSMPGMDGIEGLRRLRQAAPALRIVMISATAEPEAIRQTLACGARGYILKSSSEQTLRNALQLVLAGEIYVPAVALSGLGRSADDDLPSDSPLRSLTERQRDTLRLLVQGLSNKEIARQLGLLESTVKAHLKVILKKLGATNRTQAALLATQLGLRKAG